MIATERPCWSSIIKNIPHVFAKERTFTAATNSLGKTLTIGSEQKLMERLSDLVSNLCRA